MAIKIKRKDGSKSAPEGADSPSDTARPASGPAPVEADAVMRASWATASWIEENKTTVIIAAVVTVVVVIAAYVGLTLLENKQVEASSALTPAFDSYSTLIEGSKELDMVKANTELKDLPTFKDEKERWEKVYSAADEVLNQHASADVAIAAKLTKAAAAGGLGKHDEAIALYTEYIASTQDPQMKIAAQQGLATIYSSAERFDDALRTLDEIGAADKAYADGVRYQKARILEHTGKTAEAKSLYHQILDTDPEHVSRADIERRVANM